MSYFNLDRIDAVAILSLDTLDEKVNTLDEALMEQFNVFLEQLESDQTLKGAILISQKKDNFIAGADIEMFKSRETAQELEQLSLAGHAILNRIDELKKPLVAAIHGSCMGGGLELSLACHYRIATNHPKTVLALPEVKLGVIPGTGGTQRLPRLIGIQKALEYMLTGKNIYARTAKKIGLVDELTHKDALKEAAIKAVHTISTSGIPKRKNRLRFFEKILENNAPGRSLIFSQARKKVLKQTHGNYPAPLLIIDAVKFGYAHGLKKGLENEAKLFGKAGASPESRALVQLFFGITGAKKNPFRHAVQTVNTIGVLGAGLMGSGITDVSVTNGNFNVLLKDRTLEDAAKGEKIIWNGLNEKVKKKIITAFERDKIASKIVGTHTYDAFQKVDLIIEAVFEDLELKRRIIAEVEEHTQDHCIFASNTSSLPISEIAKDAKRPEAIIGMHYFSPVQKMPLLEIITTPQTAEWVIATAYDVGVRQGKTVIVVNDGPGFYTTRILAPYINEALLLLEEGAEIEFLDNTMKTFGFPVGPMALLDEVGLDVGAHVGETMAPMFNARGGTSSTKARALADSGYLGRKNKQGFYTYQSKKKQVNQPIYSYFGESARKNPDPDSTQLRMALMMVNEAVYCLQEGIIKSPQDGDLGAILGLGFPPFTGGPFRYIDFKGADWVATTLNTFADKFGPRFKPAPLLEDMACNGNKFYV